MFVETRTSKKLLSYHSEHAGSMRIWSLRDFENLSANTSELAFQLTHSFLRNHQSAMQVAVQPWPSSC